MVLKGCALSGGQGKRLVEGFCNLRQRLETDIGGLWLRRVRVRVPSVTPLFFAYLSRILDNNKRSPLTDRSLLTPLRWFWCAARRAKDGGMNTSSISIKSHLPERTTNN